MKYKSKTIIPLIWITICLLILVCIYPIRLFSIAKRVHSSVDRGMQDPLVIGYSEESEFYFQPTDSYIDTIAFLFNTHGNNKVPGSVTLTVYDNNKNVVCTSELPISRIGNRHEAEFHIGQKFDTSQVYSMTLTAVDYGAEPLHVYWGSAYTASPEFTDLVVSGASLSDYAPYVAYTYKVKPNLHEALPYMIVTCAIAIMGLCAISLATKYNERRNKDNA